MKHFQGIPTDDEDLDVSIDEERMERLQADVYAGEYAQLNSQENHGAQWGCIAPPHYSVD